MTRRWGIGPLRHATRNRLLALDAAGHPLLLKYTADPDDARAEVAGHRRIAAHYRVPALHAHIRVPGGRLLLYERLPMDTDRGLLLDLLNAPGPHDRLEGYMTKLSTTYLSTIGRTARLVAPHAVAGKLFNDRAAPGGRLDIYYAGRDFTALPGVSIDRLREYALHVNGRSLHVDWRLMLDGLRAFFAKPDPVWAAITQGDPTDVNLADPLAWLDHDTGGLNAVAGEFAGFAWYTTILGGWLVPRRNPRAFDQHPATFQRLHDNTPRLRATEVDHVARTIHITYDPAPAPTRRAAFDAYWRLVVEPLADRLWPGRPLGAILRPYLAMRILAVYNLADLDPEDRLLLLAMLAQCQAPDFDPATYFGTRE